MQAERQNTPLLSALLQLAQQPQAAFYTPGHKRGQGIPPALRQAWGTAVFSCDLPELPELDNLFAPTGVIAEAQALAAQTYGADHTWFLVNGSTVGIQAAILAIANPGDKILLPRTVHRSAIAGCILAGVEPIFITPTADPAWDLPLGLTPTQVETALQRFPQVQAILLVSPTYQGVVADVAAIASLAHAHGIPLIVDAAHGPHFGLHPALPPSPLALGADLVIQSTHKVLSALTQASMLHLRGERVSCDRIQRNLQLLQSSSPSYLLLASLDAARAQLDQAGLELMAQTLALATQIRSDLTHLPALPVLETKDLTGRGFRLDLTRLTLNLAPLGITGFAADDYLREQHRVVAELPTLSTLTFILSLGNTQADLHRLWLGLTALVQEAGTNSPNPGFPSLQAIAQAWYQQQPEVAGLSMSVRDAFFAPTCQVPIQAAIGRISAETLCPYPPGIPVLLPGETIPSLAIAHLQSILAAGGVITGCQDPSLQTLTVVAA